MDDNELNNYLDTLDDSDYDRIHRLIKKLAKKRKIKQKPSTVKVVDSLDNKVIDTLGNEISQKSKSRRKKTKKTGAKQGKGKRKSKKFTRPQSMVVDGPRKMQTVEDLGMGNLHSKDSRLDKILSGVNSITPRSPSRLIEVECEVCGTQDEVSEKIIMVDRDTRQVKYICNDCVREKA